MTTPETRGPGTGSSSDEVLVDVDDPVAVITLNRPERLNALTYSMLRDLRRAVDAAAADPAVVGIVITGAGRGFCSGLDAEVLRATTERGSAGRSDAASSTEGAGDGDGGAAEVPGLFTWLLAVPKPVIAAVNGVAAGGGVVLAAMSDLRFASRDASFVTVFGKRGLISEHGTTWILPRLVGAGRALDLLWSSRRVEADEALRIGLVE
jgi:enoyl-CoA hydratase/carnithine racemase